MTAAIDWGELFELVWAAAAAGIAVAIMFAALIVGATRGSDAHREDRGAVAAAYFALATVAGLAFAGGVAFGVSIIVSK